MLTENSFQKNNLLSVLKESEKKLFHLRNFRRGQMIARENETCEEIGIIVQGEVVISSYSYHGEEIIYNTLQENEVFGNNLLFSSDPHYRGNIIVNKASKVALINRKNLLLLLKENEQFLVAYLNIQSDFGKRLNATIKLLSFSSAEERFLYYLFLHGNRVNYRSVTALAKEVFMKRETLSRLLTKLVDENRIKRFRNLLVINEKSR